MNSYSRKHCISCQTNYGTRQHLGMCNACFTIFTDSRRKYREEKERNKPPVEEEPEIIEEKLTVSPMEINEEVKEVNEINSQPKQTNIYACWKCSKKVGYLGFKCKCDYIFCGTCRHFSAHDCDFDYKNYDRLKLQEQVNKANNISK